MWNENVVDYQIQVHAHVQIIIFAGVKFSGFFFKFAKSAKISVHFIVNVIIRVANLRFLDHKPWTGLYEFLGSSETEGGG